MATRKKSATEYKEEQEYRKEKRYTGYEDYSPGGRAALSTYQKNETSAGISADRQTAKKESRPAVDMGAAVKAQKVQREYSAETKRETRGKVSNEELGYDNLEDVNKKNKWKGTM